MPDLLHLQGYGGFGSYRVYGAKKFQRGPNHMGIRDIVCVWHLGLQGYAGYSGYDGYYGQYKKIQLGQII